MGIEAKSGCRNNGCCWIPPISGAEWHRVVFVSLVPSTEILVVGTTQGGFHIKRKWVLELRDSKYKNYFKIITYAIIAWLSI